MTQVSIFTACWRVRQDAAWADRPSIVAVYRDPFFKALNPVLHLDDRHVVTVEFMTQLGQLALFRKRHPATP
jgi:hypothetical protein